MLPIVIFHVGNPDYLHKVIRRNKPMGTSLTLIGDDSNRGVDATHVDFRTLETPELQEFRTHFVNYSTNSSQFEFNCFARLFYIRRWMELNNLTTCVHLDSDCILLRPTSELFDGRVAYCSWKTMEASIHVSCLTLDFLKSYEQMCHDIYVTKSRFHLIEDKIRFHKETNTPGGICDMTLYALLSRELPVQCLTEVQDDGSVFDDNINAARGFLGMDTYRMLGGIKEVYRDNGLWKVTSKDGRTFRLNNFHFQGGAKAIIRQLPE